MRTILGWLKQLVFALRELHRNVPGMAHPGTVILCKTCVRRREAPASLRDLSSHGHCTAHGGHRPGGPTAVLCHLPQCSLKEGPYEVTLRLAAVSRSCFSPWSVTLAPGMAAQQDDRPAQPT